MKHVYFILFLLASFVLHQDYIRADLYKEGRELKSLAIILCSGKSGSCTLEASFKRLEIETIRRHGLTNDLKDTILVRSDDTNVLIIDSIRDIISRKISSYFQNLPQHLGLSPQEIVAKYRSEGLNFLIEDFDKRLVTIEQYYSFKAWKTLGYDCLNDKDFNFKKKCQLKKLGNLYFLNLRFDDIDNWEKIIRSLNLPIELRNFKLVSANVSENKWYKNIYKKFQDQFTLTQADFDAIFEKNREEINHFYTRKEIRAFINKWKSRIRQE